MSERIEEKVEFSVNGNVKLQNGEWCEFSDKLRIQGVVANKGDTAIIREFGNKKIVVDIIKKRIEREVSDEELEKQLKQFNTLSGGY